MKGQQFIIAIGSLVQPYKFVGPFESREAAGDAMTKAFGYREGVFIDWIVMPISNPNDLKEILP